MLCLSGIKPIGVEMRLAVLGGIELVLKMKAEK
jgi:hypothetical protein